MSKNNVHMMRLHFILLSLLFYTASFCNPKTDTLTVVNNGKRSISLQYFDNVNSYRSININPNSIGVLTFEGSLSAKSS